MSKAVDGLIAPSETRTGRLAGHPDGFGFVTTDRGTVYVAKADLGEALHDDEVELRCWAAERGFQGKVERIVARPERRMTGTLEGETFVADDPRMARPLTCEAPDEAPGHDTIVGVVLMGDVGGGAETEVVRTFGPRGRARAEEDAMLWREELDVPIPEEALLDAQRAAARPLDQSGREDLRALDFVTIDPATAEDHDDALFAQPTPDGGLTVWVAIADVSAFVDPNGPLDEEARRRGASIYLPGRVAPMLPNVLSSDAASLVPDVDRPAVVLQLALDAEGQLVSRTLSFAMIRSKARLSYEHVGEILSKPANPSNGSPAPGPTVRAPRSRAVPARASTPAEDPKRKEPTRIVMLRRLSEIAQKLRTARRARGALAIESAETVIDTDAEGQPVAIRRIEHDVWAGHAHQLVEEMMLAANEAVAGMLREARIDAVFRSHADPTPERLERVVALAAERGVELTDEARRDPRVLRTVLGAVKDAALREELGTALLGALSSAIYQDRREDHFALASREYVHFTSPIRRYADLTIHRALRALSSGQPIEGLVDTELLNETQRRARAMHREIGDLHAAILVRDRVGQELTGTVVHATKQDWIVSIDEPAIQVRCKRSRDPVDVGTRIALQLTTVSIPARRIEGRFVRALPAAERA